MARKIRRVISVLLMITAILVTQIPATDVVAAGFAVGDYTMDGTTLVKYNGSEPSVTIPNAVKRIGPEAFSGNTNLSSLVISSSVETVDFSAFENCKKLSTVIFEEGVRTIGSSAFSGCDSLSKVSMGEKVSKIGSAAFAKCTSLSDIEILSSNDDFICKDGVLYNHDQTKIIQYLAGKPTTSYFMPDSVKEIEEYAFWGASLLTQLTISSSVEVIPEYAFANCNGLSIVTIPESVHSINAYAFGDCDNLNKVYIPNTVGYIDKNAFTSSKNVSVETVATTETPVSDNSNTENIKDNTASVSKDEVDASKVYVDFSENVIPGELGAGKIMGGNAVLLMSPKQPVRGVNLPTTETEDGIAESGSKTLYSPEDYVVLLGTLAEYNGEENDVTIPTNVSNIGDRVFYDNEKIHTVGLPEKLTEIGDFAFARSALNAIKIPEGVTKIGYASFYHCSDLSEVIIPQSTGSIDLGAFEGTKWLNNWLQSADESTGDFLIVGDGILLAYRGNGGDVVIPNDVKSIGAECFKGNETMQSVQIPDGVVFIGEDAFNGCKKLNEIVLPKQLVTIDDRAFMDCSFVQISIPESVTEIGVGAFDATAIGSPLQVVVFEGDSIPLLTYNATATRLSGENLRTMAFEGVPAAIVNENVETVAGSILDHNSPGFRGLIYKITSEPAGNEAGGLELQSCTLMPDEVTGLVEIDVHANLSGKDYIMTGVKQDAFNAYLNVEAWSGLRLTDIQVLGNASDAMNRLIEGIPYSTLGGSVNDIKTEATAIFVYSDKEGMSTDSGLVTAIIPGNTKSYTMIISEKEDTSDRINEALAIEYGALGGMEIFTMDISMYDSFTMVPITKLANSKMEICMPIPTNLLNKDNLGVVTTDSNGMPEVLSSQVVNVNGSPCIQFVASHFSPYAIYQLPTVSENEVVTNSKLVENIAEGNVNDYRIRTLHESRFDIQPKWMIAGMLALLSVVLFFAKGKKRSKII